MYRLAFIGSLIFILASSVKVTGDLPKSLKEISGWVFVNDSTLIAHNDSGNDAKIFVIKPSGKILHECMLKDVNNVDFEAITYDGKSHVYLGDIGNNDNTRKNLVVYKLKLDKLLIDDEITPKKIFFSYPEQKQFPPKPSERYYDAEALAYRKDSLYIITKCRTQPFDGNAQVYVLPTTAGTYLAKKKTTIKIGKRDVLRDAVTSAEFFNHHLYVITYNRLIIYSLKKGLPVFKKQIPLFPITQKEALAVNKNGLVYLADERNKLLGGGLIYTVNTYNK